MILVCEREFNSSHLAKVKVGEVYEFNFVDGAAYQFVDDNNERWIITKGVMLNHFSFISK